MNRTVKLYLVVFCLGFSVTETIAQAFTLKQARTFSIDSLQLLLKRPDLADSSQWFLLLTLSRKLYEGNDPKSLEVGQRTLAQARKMKDTTAIAKSYLNLGLFSMQYNDFVGAQYFYQQGAAVAIAGKLPITWIFYNGMAGVAYLTNDYASTVRYLRQARDQQQRAPVGSVSVHEKTNLDINIGNTYLALQKLDSAAIYAHRALLDARKNLKGPQPLDFRYLRNLSAAYALKGQIFMKRRPLYPALLDSAGRNLRLGIQYGQAESASIKPAAMILALSDVHRFLGQRLEAQRTAEQGLQWAKELHSPTLRVQALRQLAWSYADQGNALRSYEQNEQATILQDSIFNKDKAEALAQLQVKFGVQEQQQRLALLKQQNKAAAARQREQRTRLKAAIVVSALLALGLVTSGLLYWRLRRREVALAQANEEITHAHADISRSAAEKEVLLQEIHHRVKNNLQLVSSLLGWQSSINPDPALVQVLAGSQARIHSMALVHELLYHSDNLAEVRLDTYLSRLLETLQTSYSSAQRRIAITKELAPLVMTAKEAIPFGLLVNELVTNAYKHAFAQRSNGHLHVELRGEGEGFQLIVADDGVGLPDAGEVRPASLGTQLIASLARQLKAIMAVEPNEPSGTRVVLARSFDK